MRLIQTRSPSRSEDDLPLRVCLPVRFPGFAASWRLPPVKRNVSFRKHSAYRAALDLPGGKGIGGMGRAQTCGQTRHVGRIPSGRSVDPAHLHRCHFEYGDQVFQGLFARSSRPASLSKVGESAAWTRIVRGHVIHGNSFSFTEDLTIHSLLRFHDAILTRHRENTVKKSVKSTSREIVRRTSCLICFLSIYSVILDERGSVRCHYFGFV
jgi:hypothetical protein